MEKILAVYDRDKRYTERLGSFLRHRKELPFQIYSFADAGELERFSRKKKIDILLYTKDKEARQLHSVAAGERIQLSETETENVGEELCIYKYQAGDSIVKELLCRYGEEILRAPGGEGRARLYMVFSPVGRCGKTGFAWELARQLSEEYPTLFLSLEESGSFQRGFSENFEGGLSEALYYFKEGNLEESKLQKLCQEKSGLSFLPKMKNSDDLSILSSRELARFLEQLMKISSYPAIVVDTDSIVSRFYESFSLCHRVFLPIREDACSRDKLQGLHDFLENAGMDSVEERFVKLLLPAPSDAEEAAGGFRSSIRDYAEAVIRHYIL